MPAAVGDVIAGKYRVEGILGQGGMGMVLLAHHLELDERVAIKQLLPNLVADQNVVARFLREGRNAVKIKSEHVARVFDVARLADGSPIIVMEHLDGGDLARLIKLQRVLHIDDALEITIQACEAAASAHAVGIIHRDLKPANIFLTERLDGTRCVKVLDFGISKAIGDKAAFEAALTSTTGVVGSPTYMSPEQMTTPRDVDARTDIWSLGVMLYRMLAGRLPFPAENALELAARVASMPPLPLRADRPDLPEAVEAIVMRCLERSREKRYATVAELAEAIATFDPRHRSYADRIKRIERQRAPGGVAKLDEIELTAGDLSETGVTAAVTLVREPIASTTPAHTATPTPTTTLPPRRRSRGLLLALPIALVALIAGAFVMLRRPQPVEQPAAPATPPPAPTPSAAPTPVVVPPEKSAPLEELPPTPSVSVAVAPKPVATTTTQPAAAKTPIPKLKGWDDPPPPKTAPKPTTATSGGWGDRW